MKRLIDFTTIAFFLLLTAISGVSSLETVDPTGASISFPIVEPKD